MVQEPVDAIAVGRLQMVDLEKGFLQYFEITTYLEGLLLYQSDSLQRESLEIIAYRTQVLRQRHRASIFTDENPVAQALAAYRKQAAAGRIQTNEVMLVRNTDELARQVIRPAMIPTDQPATGCAGIIAHDRPAPMPARIIKSVDLIVLVPNEQNRRTGSLPQFVATALRKLVLVPCVQPGLFPEMLAFEFLKPRIRIAATGNVG